MNATCSRIRSECPLGQDEVVCRCLGVTRDEIVTHIETLGLRTLNEVRQHTEAGDGCTCCHAKIRALLARHADELSYVR